VEDVFIEHGIDRSANLISHSGSAISIREARDEVGILVEDLV
jgi:hypothetical protein